ncbi:hypothetical protein NEOLEDRAFT_1142735 [Neolentinus lepideus HHB14362 ss-1]|uniref:Uncharacterized protein n=1 Tax=Neolentinus lepideus HHB14362 ss-1 TaxID=1314782 RepID=A0A165MYD5_9AGAM|nr:hypothetical protein NEOLEDRAFT_1142735 [Neolentinus lepideus HHB14362 ss-1]
MDNFSWSDSIQAVLAPCLPCFRPRTNSNEGNRARPDLEGLLADVETDTEAETVSLHSNIGDRNRRRKKKKRGGNKSISLFGYDLFGRPPIQLPESDDEDRGRGRRRGRAMSGQLTASSSATLDSDASPLDPVTIDQLSAMQVQARAALEEERRQKEERRAQRQERKLMKKVAAALALESADGAGDFEGFPGSGGAVHGNIPSPFRAGSSQGGYEEPLLDVTADMEDENADFGGELYAKRVASNNSDRGSDSRSRTSGTLSSSGDPSRMYNHHYTSQPMPPSGVQYYSEEFIQQPGLESLPKKKKKKSGKSKSSHDSASSTSQSQSIPSPVTAFPESHPEVAEGSPARHLPRVDIPNDTSGGFPSAGLGGIRRKNSDMGVFLARRGDE